MDSLFTLLQNRDLDEPPEIRDIKAYVRQHFDSEVAVMVRDKDIVITASGAALVNSLRLRGPDLKKAAATDKKLVFRIG